jgi:formate hydrogenlyase transcriptional activator
MYISAIDQSSEYPHFEQVPQENAELSGAGVEQDSAGKAIIGPHFQMPQVNLPIRHPARYSRPETLALRERGGIDIRHTDIIEGKRNEEALLESEQRYRLLIDAVPVMVWMSGTDGLCTDFNQSWLDFRGRTMEQELGEGWLEGVHPEDKQRRIDNYLAAFHDRESFTMQYRLRRSDGEFIWMFDNGVPRFTRDGGFLGYIGSCTDITERKRMEEELTQALLELRRLKEQRLDENVHLREDTDLAQHFGQIIGHSGSLKLALVQAGQVAPTDSTVLITGETGTGKELLAHAIHSLSPRRHRPLVKVNCSALPATLIESELFGHEKGAFTGANARRIGRFELAHGGTIFLDEIGDLPPELQAKLLRVLQEREFERLGSNRAIKVDVRVVTATNHNLEDAVCAGTFRDDLYFRLNVFPIHLPPLRERREDIQELASFFVNQFSQKLGKRIDTIPADALKALECYAWPGNVRELINVLERSVILSAGSKMRLADSLRVSLAAAVNRGAAIGPKAAEPKTSERVAPLEEVEREHILEVMERTYWRVEGEYGAAAILGLRPGTLRSRLKKLGIRRPLPRQ